MAVKFDMFEGMDDEVEKEYEGYTEIESVDILDEVPDVDQDEVSSTKVNKRGRGGQLVSYRSKEEYEALIIDRYTETLTHPVTGEVYEVPVTVFQPEENPMELLRPAFAFGTH